MNADLASSVFICENLRPILSLRQEEAVGGPMSQVQLLFLGVFAVCLYLAQGLFQRAPGASSPDSQNQRAIGTRPDAQRAGPRPALSAQAALRK